MGNENRIPDLWISLTTDELKVEDLQEIALSKLRNICQDVAWGCREQQHAFERGVELAANVFCLVRMARNVSDGAEAASGRSGKVSFSVCNPTARRFSDA